MPRVTLYIRSDDTTCQLKGTSTTNFPKHSVDSHAIQYRQERLLMQDVCAYSTSANMPVILHLPLDAKRESYFPGIPKGHLKV